MSSFSPWLWIFCSSFGLPIAIKTKLPKITDIDVKLKESQIFAIFGNFVLIATGKLDKLQKIYNYVEKEDILSFLQIFVDIL